MHDAEVVPTDFIHGNRNSIYESLVTKRKYLKGGKRFFKVVSGYSDERGCSCRTVYLWDAPATSRGVVSAGV
ncbi:MAG: hypothetical protein NTU62_08670 [Spirochaetes bacterium]|nr:hypothetical protein [Spirochaetota bacterium]